jgi:hypothetical protein
MSLCETVIVASEELADLLLAADNAEDDGDNLRLLRRAIDAAHAVKVVNHGARALLAAATADIAQLHPDALQAANDHGALPLQPDPIIA